MYTAVEVRTSEGSNEVIYEDAGRGYESNEETKGSLHLPQRRFVTGTIREVYSTVGSTRGK